MGLFARSHRLSLLAPTAGVILELASLPDPVFAQGILGPGFGVDSGCDVVFSPIDARVELVLDSKHAVYLSGPGGLQVLVHVGLDTVKLGGQGFDAHIATGDQVVAGQPLLTCDRQAVRRAGFATMALVCLSELGEYARVDVRTGHVQQGDVAATVSSK